MGTLCDVGVTEIDTMVALVTLKGTDSVTEPRLAVIVTAPGESPDTAPVELIEANAGLDEDQLTAEVRL